MEKKLQAQSDELSDLHRRKDEFLAMLSHELRNPLASMINAVELLRLQKLSENGIQQRSRTILERQLGDLKHLVDDLLEVSRITTGRIRLRQELVPFADIVEGALQTVRPIMENRRHQFIVNVPIEPVWLIADLARLGQVLVNLLTNAAKYTDEGGRVWLEVRREKETCVVSVRDTGIGIAAELLPRIFDLFTQAERLTDRSQGGLGIGLCLVQRLVELHGGTVEARSVVGEGSEFIVRVPASKAPAARAKSAETVAAVSSRRHVRVLVVDDDVDMAESTAILLRESGHDVRTAHNGSSALQLALEYMPHAVLLDIGLPGMSGHEVARRMRELPALKNTIIVAVTGYGQENDSRISREAGFNHHLVKPAEYEEIHLILDSIEPA
jgi:CheY-like chemotaxis protein/two-component sensor histidine kinase